MRPVTVILCLVVLFLLPSGVVADNSATITPSVCGPMNGVYLYAYHVRNDPRSAKNMHGFALADFQEEFVVDSVRSPSGWKAVMSARYIHWFSTAHRFDLPPGSTRDFLFQSPAPPAVGMARVQMSFSAGSEHFDLDFIDDRTTGPLADPPSVSFTAFHAFTAEVEAAKDTFAMQGRVTLAPGSDELDLRHEEVALGLTGGTAAFCTTIPAGAFTKDEHGRVQFEGTLHGVHLAAQLIPLGGHQFEFKVEGEHANLTGIANPVTVALTIGDHSGSTTVTATLKDDHDTGEKDHDERDRDTEPPKRD